MHRVRKSKLPVCKYMYWFVANMSVLLSFFGREFHREQLSIENSMHDLDSAVGRLDNIFMTLYIVVITIIFAVVLVRIRLHFALSSITFDVYDSKRNLWH